MSESYLPPRNNDEIAASREKQERKKGSRLLGPAAIAAMTSAATALLLGMGGHNRAEQGAPTVESAPDAQVQMLQESARDIIHNPRIEVMHLDTKAVHDKSNPYHKFTQSINLKVAATQDDGVVNRINSQPNLYAFGQPLSLVAHPLARPGESQDDLFDTQIDMTGQDKSFAIPFGEGKWKLGNPDFDGTRQYLIEHEVMIDSKQDPVNLKRVVADHIDGVVQVTSNEGRIINAKIVSNPNYPVGGVVMRTYNAANTAENSTQVLPPQK